MDYPVLLKSVPEPQLKEYKMGISITQLLIVLGIVIILFGTKKIRNIGSDLGGAIKSFRSAVREGESEEAPAKITENKSNTVVDGEIISEKKEKV